ncbi:methyltransferase [Halosegnis rubeus]|uniref:Methyltransferase n=1 Tax=Halosegnis rubeus TaxID=2212850 RepID=A0A5N5UKY9_9EURY|nr:HemK2/MTQ2 family protein methyltransferase [Halosegnis rubeus]KAB7514042.1 methyltransferase [Halosegnis rubeus]KAB7514210.1 methyltransferase [Halosegnis rubeus]KAB7518940.1 methyltransferase [Halosegnis rubeus]
MSDLADQRGMETAVYQPAEDSKLLADVAVESVDGSDRVLDVGTGSGYVAGRIASATAASVVASDVNPHACRQARDNAREETIPLDVVRGDCTRPFDAETFDAVTFNPPYLPRDEAAERDDWMERALTGGETGREVIESFLDDVARVLTSDGVVFLLVSTLTDIEAVAGYAADRSLAAETAREESFPFERLAVLRITEEH